MSPNDLALVRAESDGPLVIAEIVGEVDPSNSRDIGTQLSGAVPNDSLGVVLDLTDVAFLDSSGVHMLFELAERLAARQQQLTVAVPPDSPARRVLDIVAFEESATVLDSRDEAIATARTA